MENLLNKPANFCPKCQELVELSGLSVRQVMYFHEADCNPEAKKRKASKKMKHTEPELLNDLNTKADFVPEVNAVCGQEIQLKS